MTILDGPRPAIALVDDDFHSSRLMSRVLAEHGGPRVECLADADQALSSLSAMTTGAEDQGAPMVVADLKASSRATRDFIARLKETAPSLVVVAMAPSLDRDIRSVLLDAGAAAVFERHADFALYCKEAVSILSFWERTQRPVLVGA